MFARLQRISHASSPVRVALRRNSNVPAEAAAPAKPVVETPVVSVPQPEIKAPKKKSSAKGLFFGFLAGLATAGGVAYTYVFEDLDRGNRLVLAKIATLETSVNQV
eukprot:Colp12_sorted_trinity150504_noHs@6629